VNKLLGGQKSIPRYVPATDFGHIWEHLKTYALLAKGAEKYVAFVLPELVSKYEKCHKKT
jgi:hypothetical protein